jgi:hypothetical protein
MAVGYGDRACARQWLQAEVGTDVAVAASDTTVYNLNVFGSNLSLAETIMIMTRGCGFMSAA